MNYNKLEGLIDIGNLELALAALMILVAAIISLLLSLGLVRSLLIATARTFIQLLALGFILRWLFTMERAYIVIGMMIFMCIMAAQTSLARVKASPGKLYLNTFVSIMLSGFIFSFFLLAVIINVEPWYKARYLIPLGGMVIGNSMNGLSIGLDRLFSDLRSRRHEVEMILALGGTRWESSLKSIRSAVAAGMIPTINAMSAVGLVHVPGMMTGQVLAGADPIIAAKYQILIMLTLTAATAFSMIMALLLLYRRAFSAEAIFRL